PRVQDDLRDRSQGRSREAFRLLSEVAHRPVAQGGRELELGVNARRELLIEEVRDGDAEKGAQTMKVLHGRIAAHTCAQLLKGARRRLVADKTFDRCGHVSIGVFTPVRAADGLKQMVESGLEAGHGSRWRSGHDAPLHKNAGWMRAGSIEISVRI